MTKNPIGAAVFAKPVNAIYNTLHNENTTGAGYHTIMTAEGLFLNLGGMRALNNAKMSLGPAIDRACLESRQLTYASTVIRTISNTGLS